MIEHVEQRARECFGSPSAFKRVYLTEPDGPAPVDPYDDDQLSAVKRKFYLPFDAVRTQLEQRLDCTYSVLVRIDPAIQDQTAAMLTLEDKHILLSYSCKPWKLWWPSRTEMRKELEEWYRTTLDRYREVTGQFVQTPGNRLYLVSFQLISNGHVQPFYNVLEAKNPKELRRGIDEYLRHHFTGGPRKQGKTWFYGDGGVRVNILEWRQIYHPMQVVDELRK